MNGSKMVETADRYDPRYQPGEFARAGGRERGHGTAGNCAALEGMFIPGAMSGAWVG